MKDRPQIRKNLLALQPLKKTGALEESTCWLSVATWDANYGIMPSRYFAGVTRTNNHALYGMQFTTKIVPIRGVDHYLIIRIK